MMVDFQVFSEHLELTSNHFHQRLQQASMDGSGPMLLKVRTKDKNLIVELIIVRAHSAWRCHGCVFQEREKLEIGEGGQLEDVMGKECDKKKTRRI